MPAAFPIEHDDEFYVFLKSSLPEGYRIESEPSSAYYSEWLFKYNLFEGERLIETYQGDFRALEKGTLVGKAMRVLDKIEKGNV